MGTTLSKLRSIKHPACDKIEQPPPKRICLDEEENQSEKEEEGGTDNNVLIDNRTCFEKIFENHLILQVIFRHLDVDSLIKARQVSKQWAGESAKLMFEKRLFKIPFDFRKKSPRKQVEIIHGLKTLSSSKNITIQKLSCNGIEDFDIFALLEIPFGQIKELKFPFPKARDFQNVMRADFPNLTTLTNNYDEDSTPYYNSRLLRVFMSLKKPLTISHLIFEPSTLSWDDVDKIYGKIARSKIKAKSITLDPLRGLGFFLAFQPEHSELITSLLKKSKHVLEELTIASPLRTIIASPSFPQLAKVKKLNLNITLLENEFTDEALFGGQLFPLDFDLNDIFPNLTTVEISVKFSDNADPGDLDDFEPFDFWTMSFEPIEPVSSVKTVIYQDLGNVNFDTASLSEIFPEATFIFKD